MPRRPSKAQPPKTPRARAKRSTTAGKADGAGGSARPTRRWFALNTETDEIIEYQNTPDGTSPDLSPYPYIIRGFDSEKDAKKARTEFGACTHCRQVRRTWRGGKNCYICGHPIVRKSDEERSNEERSNEEHKETAT